VTAPQEKTPVTAPQEKAQPAAAAAATPAAGPQVEDQPPVPAANGNVATTDAAGQAPAPPPATKASSNDPSWFLFSSAVVAIKDLIKQPKAYTCLTGDVCKKNPSNPYVTCGDEVFCCNAGDTITFVTHPSKSQPKTTAAHSRRRRAAAEYDANLPMDDMMNTLDSDDVGTIKKRAAVPASDDAAAPADGGVDNGQSAPAAPAAANGNGNGAGSVDKAAPAEAPTADNVADSSATNDAASGPPPPPPSPCTCVPVATTAMYKQELDNLSNEIDMLSSQLAGGLTVDESAGNSMDGMWASDEEVYDTIGWLFY